MKTIVTLLIALGLLVPVLAEAKSTPKDKQAPSITSLHIESSNASSSSIAVPGNTVTLSFTTSEKIQKPVVLVNAKPLFLRAVNSSGNTWAATYTVDNKDPLGKAAWAIAMADIAGNPYVCTYPRIFIIPYCPTTDGSSVTIKKDGGSTPPPPPPPGDTTAPVITAHADVSASVTDETSVAVSYTLPTATDNVDGTVAVSCTPASGSDFEGGTTTVACSAQDAAGNVAHSSFAVHVEAIYIMKQQADESYLCGETTGTWQVCDQTGTFGFTQDFGPTATIDLGLGSDMGEGALHSLTIANTPQDIFHPWLITLNCYDDAQYEQLCNDWDSVSQTASQSGDNVHWTANFDDLTTLNSDRYYQMVIDHRVSNTEWPAPTYGSLSLVQPYFILRGLLR